VFGHTGSWASSLNLANLNGANGFAITGIAGGDGSGASIAGAGDVNGDGVADLMIGTFAVNSQAGASYVVFGHTGSWASSLNLANLNGANGFSIPGIAEVGSSGRSVAGAGDVNGDGVADFIIGASTVNSQFGSQAGASYVVFGYAGSWAPSLNLANLNGANGFGVLGISLYGQSGYSVSGAGDVNGDDIGDFIIGAPGVNSGAGASFVGASYVVFGVSSTPMSSSITHSTTVTPSRTTSVMRTAVVFISNSSDATPSASGMFSDSKTASALVSPTSTGSQTSVITMSSSKSSAVSSIFSTSNSGSYSKSISNSFPENLTPMVSRLASTESSPSRNNISSGAASKNVYISVPSAVAGSVLLSIIFGGFAFYHRKNKQNKQRTKIPPKSWHFEGKPDSSEGASYILLSASELDIQKVLQCYAHHSVPGYDIQRVEVIYNAGMNRSFALNIRHLQERSANDFFLPAWSREAEPSWRNTINERWKSLAAPHHDKDYPDVKIMPLWHGTKPEVLGSIFTAGYAALGKTDAGFFGQGIYSANEAEYAYRVYGGGGFLILNWVAGYSAYPVIRDDMEKITGKNHYQNYDSHFVPVVPNDPNNPNETVYYPTIPGQEHQYTEVVVFDKAQCLPRYLVTLQPTLPRAPSTVNEAAGPSMLFSRSLKKEGQSSKGNFEKESRKKIQMQGL
jgi:Poly(ADP-ribose) polymerase catalytic domain/FG-GAP repeat